MAEQSSGRMTILRHSMVGINENQFRMVGCMIGYDKVGWQ